MWNKFLATFMVVITLAACSSQGHKADIGQVSGAILGGVASSHIGEGQGKTAALIAGTLLGSFVGKSIGTSLDRADMMYYHQAQQKAYTASIGEAIQWNNPKSNHSGIVKPTREGVSSVGAYCREFEQTVIISGQRELAYGTACQQPDGTWRIIN